MYLEVLSRVAFLIIIAILGWIIGKKFKTNSKDISNLLIYLFSPVVFFILIVKSPADVSYVGYSLVSYLWATLASFAALGVGRILWKDNRANLFAAGGGNGNVGYFVLPLAIGLLQGTENGAIAIAIVVFIKVAMAIFEFTVAFYLAARGLHSIKESLIIVAKMPTLHAAILALIVKYFHIQLPAVLMSGLSDFTGGYSILGMMLIGLSLAKFDRILPDWKFIFSAVIWKHGVYAIVSIWFFSTFFHLNDAEKIVMIMMACNPLASNISAVATSLDIHPEKAAGAIMVSTLFAVITVPLTISLALKLLH